MFGSIIFHYLLWQRKKNYLSFVEKKESKNCVLFFAKWLSTENNNENISNGFFFQILFMIQILYYFKIAVINNYIGKIAVFNENFFYWRSFLVRIM